MENKPAETFRADVRAGSRRKPAASLCNADSHANSAFANLLTTIMPVVVSSSSNVTLPTTTTWFEMGKRRAQIADGNDDEDAQIAMKKRKRLGQAKMKRDRIQQEIDEATGYNRTLQASLNAANKRITQLQGAQARYPTAMDVCLTYFRFLFTNNFYCLLNCRCIKCSRIIILIVHGQFHPRPYLCICRYKRTKKKV